VTENTMAAHAVATELLKELRGVSEFIHGLAFGEQEEKGPTPTRTEDAILADLIGFVHTLDTRIDELTNKLRGTAADGLAPPSDAVADISAGDVNIDMLTSGQDLNATVNSDAAAEEEEIRKARPVPRPWTFFGQSSKAIAHAGPTEDMTPLRRSMSIAYGRRRRSTWALAGMPGFSLEPAMGGAQLCWTLNSKRHTVVLRKPLDVRHALLEAQVPYLEDIDSTDFDACLADNPHLRRTYNGLPTMTVVVANVFLRYTFMQTLRISVPKLLSFLSVIEAHHRNANPFHNSLHAANVVQMVHVYLAQKDSQKESLNDLQLCALLFAALTMHTGHLGVHDAFLDVTSHPITVIYPEGTQKAMSVSMALTILFRDECNFLESAFTEGVPELRLESGSVREEFVFLVSHITRSADDTLHSELLAQLNFIHEKNYAGDDHILFVLAALLRVASASHGFKSPAVCLEWLARSAAEGYREGSAQLRWYCRQRDVNIKEGVDYLEDAQVPPHQQPPSINQDVRIVDFFHSALKNYVAPLITFQKGYFSDTWKERLNANINSLWTDGEKVNRAIHARARELFDFDRHYFAPLHKAIGAWTEPDDGRGFFSVISLVQNEDGTQRAKKPAASSSQPLPPIARRPVVVANQPSAAAPVAGANPIIALAGLVAYVRKRCIERHAAAERSGRAVVAASHVSPIVQLAGFAREWVALLMEAESSVAGTAFIVAPQAPMSAASFGLAPNSKRCIKTGAASAVPDEMTCIAIIRTLAASMGQPSQTVPSAIRSIVADLTNLCLAIE
jgi:hypothetical protein